LVGMSGLAKIGADFGLSEKSVRTHKFKCMGLPPDHGKLSQIPVAPAVVQAVQQRVSSAHKKNIMDEIDDLDREVLDVLERNKNKNDKLVLDAAKESRGMKLAKKDLFIAQQAIEAQEQGMRIEIELVDDDGKDASQD